MLKKNRAIQSVKNDWALFKQVCKNFFNNRK